MFIEDIISAISHTVQMNHFDSKIIYSFQNQLIAGCALTEKQANLALKILNRQQDKISTFLGKDIKPYLNNPIFKLKLREVNTIKRLSIVENKAFGKVVKAEFLFNDEIISFIREHRSTLLYALWNPDGKSWIFSLDERTLKFLLSLVDKFNFIYDEELADYFSQIQKIQEKIENYIPMLSLENENIVFKNVSNLIPQPDTQDIVESLFLARKVGIQIWNDDIDKKIKEQEIESHIIDFLNSSPGIPYEFNLENNSLDKLSNIVKHLTPCIFVIPGGTEYDKVKQSVNFLNNLGIDNSEISVLFRLPKESGEKFNLFVKENQLNNPLSNKIKAIFISGKVPKTVIESKLQINSVINFNFYSIHYTIREFLKNHHNVINVIDKSRQRTLNFDYM